MKFKLSEYQNSILDFVENGKGNACIQAYAGAAKSSTLVECANLIGNGNNLFVAFNKRIQLELSEKLSHTTMKASTLHGLGYSIIMSQIARGNKIDLQKLQIEVIIGKTKKTYKYGIEPIFPESNYFLIDFLTHRIEEKEKVHILKQGIRRLDLWLPKNIGENESVTLIL